MNTRAALIASIAAFTAILSASAFASVQPPQEWLDASEANRQRYEQMKPQLHKWVKGEVEDWRLPEPVALESIGAHFGETRETRTVSLDSAELRFGQLDLNFDGVVDQLDVLELGYKPAPRKAVSVANTKGVNNLIIVRADFSNSLADTATWNYDYTYNLMLADGTAPNPSFHDFFEEVSYGDLDIQGTVDNQGPNNGWYTAPNTRNYYRDTSIMEFMLFAAQSIDPHTDFSDYDSDNDGYVDSFIVYYPYAEFAGGLWPHMSSGMNYYADGVVVDIHYISGFGGAFSTADNMTVACHEYGHIMGFPDLYDTDGSSNGCGRWTLMAYQYDSQQKPPAPDPWLRQQAGWINPLVITEDATGVSIPQIATNRFMLKLWKNGDPGEEYFLVENRQKVGTDATRPGAGLMIYHCDDSQNGNTNDARRLVDVEVAEGLDGNNKDHLDRKDGGGGKATDPFYSGNKTAFNFTSNPPSKTYANTDSYVKVENISASGSTMTANISVETATRPSVTITAPTAGGTVSGDVTFSATAAASGARTISKVDFYANGYFVGTDTTATSSTYSITWNSRTCYNKAVFISAKATDSTGETGTRSISVTVDNEGEWPFSDGITNTWNWAILDPSGTASWALRTTVYNSPPSCLGIGPGYDTNEHDRILSPLLDLTGSTQPALTYYMRYKIAGSLHNARVYVISEDGSVETQVKSFTGTDLSWKSRAIWLDGFAGQKVFIAFELNSTSLGSGGGAATGSGVWVDDVDLHERTSPPSLNSITPGDGSTVSGDVAIEVDATDDVGVTYVAFWMNGEYVGADTSSPFVYTWNSRDVFNGGATVLARAYDRDEQYDEAQVTYTIDNGMQTPAYYYGFEDAAHLDDYWRIYNPTGPGTWQLANYRYYRGSYSAYCGEVSTHLYGAYEYDWLISPTIDLTGANSPFLSFFHRYETEAGYDYAKVYATTNLYTWDLLGQFDGTFSSWQRVEYSLSSYNQPVKLAFMLQSDPYVEGEGWYLDDVMLRQTPVVQSITPSRAHIGQTITIAGSSFGGYYPGALVLSGHGAVTAGEVTSWTDTEIVLNVPSGTTSGNVAMWWRDTGASLTIILPPPTLGGVQQY